MTHKKLIRNCISIATGLMIFSSCQKVIELDLNSASPEIVIEGNLSNLLGPYTIALSKTVNFSESNTFPPCTGAAITINDNAGNSEVLTESSPGIYKTNTLQGIVGRAYTIIVTSNGKEYQAVSNIPAPVTIDSLTVITSSGMGGPGMGGPGNVNKTIEVKFTDPAGIDNYYRLEEMVNGKLINNISITSDRLRDGEKFKESMRGGSDIRLQIGDTVTVLLQSIDKNVYEYFRTLNQSSGGGGFTSSAPANPTSNLSNGALGYFNAHSVTSKTVIIQ